MRQKQHTCPHCGCTWTNRGRTRPSTAGMSRGQDVHHLAAHIDTVYEFAAPQRFGQSVAMPTLPTSAPVSGGTQTATEYHRWEMNDIGVALALAGATGVLLSGAFLATTLAFRAETWANWIAWPIAGILDIASLVFLAKTWTFLRDDLAILKVATAERPGAPTPSPTPAKAGYHITGEFNVPVEKAPETQSTQLGNPIVSKGPKRDSQKMHKIYLDFAIRNPRSWYLFCQAVHSKLCNFSGRAADSFGIDNTKGSEWDAIIEQFAKLHLLKSKTKDRTKPTLNTSGEWVVDQFAATPPLLE